MDTEWTYKWPIQSQGPVLVHQSFEYYSLLKPSDADRDRHLQVFKSNCVPVQSQSVRKYES